MKIPVKNKIILFLKWAAIFLICFAFIYLFVFFGGWKLFESGDPILIEVGVALVLSVLVFAFSEVVTALERRISTLEKRIDELEKKR